MCGAIVTSPFDVVKTRLQSSLFREKHMSMGILSNGGGGAAGGAVVVPRQVGGIFWHFIETGHIIRFARFTRFSFELQFISSQNYLSRRICAGSVQRYRSYTGWRRPSTVYQLLHVRKWQTNLRQRV
jgi:hypothetical protein